MSTTSSVGLPPLPGSGKIGKAKNLSTSFENDNSLLQVDVNPFKLPNDDQIFRLREEERRNKDKAKETLKVWEKSKTAPASRAERLRDLVGDEKVLSLNNAIKEEAETAKIALPRRQEKENTSEFVAKKREMFLVQMSLDTKREEIRKLEEKAQMKEDALQRSEQMLEEDAMRFDAFLKASLFFKIEGDNYEETTDEKSDC